MCVLVCVCVCINAFLYVCAHKCRFVDVCGCMCVVYLYCVHRQRRGGRVMFVLTVV